MLRRIFIFTVFLLLLIARAYAYDDHDFQVWSTEVEEVKINKSSRMTLEEEFRWGDNAREFYYQHYDLGFIYSLHKNIDVGMGYRQVYEKKKGKFKLENEPYIIFSLLWDLYGFKFDDRSRMEYRHFDYQTDLWRYRNKFRVRLPWKFGRLQVQPFLADEIFLGSKGTAFNQNRFYSGITLNLTKNLKGEIYYLLYSTKGSVKWTDANVLGTALKLSF